ncbi:CPBP family intramembrane glutamic endopeptidase [Aeromicrobium sp. Sec7.5]|uniref:CPBP family intramembrane glutamic endopeptidase n=1 Tax=Aeromicrobium sp. Sec7.5 TaxID=3121276 RepID=UPI002FE4F3A1
MSTPYHLLTRDDPRHRAWQLPVAGAMTLGAFVVVATLAGAGPLDPVDRPGALAVDLGTIALAAPLLLGALWLTGSPALRLLWSVEGRVRWGWWGRCCAITFGAVTLALVLASALPGSGVGREVQVPTMTAWFGVVVALVLVPGRAIAEELVFRGYLPQLIGTVVPVAWIGVAASTCFFAAVQGGGTWGLVQGVLLGLTAGVLTQRTGGLEAAVALNVAHHVMRLGLEAGGAMDPSQLRADLGATSVLPTLVSVLLVGVLVEWQVRATGLVTRRIEADGTGVRSAELEAAPHPDQARPPARVRPRSPAYPGDISDDWGR